MCSLCLHRLGIVSAALFEIAWRLWLVRSNPYLSSNSFEAVPCALCAQLNGFVAAVIMASLPAGFQPPL